MSNVPLQRMSHQQVVIGLAAGKVDITSAAKEDPGTALAILAQVHSDGGTKLPVLARAVDTTLGLIADLKEARALLDAFVASSAQVEFVGAYADRLSVILQLADIAVVLAALEVAVSQAHSEEDEDEEDLPSPAQSMFLIQAWAHNLRLREDWEQILDHEVGGYTLRDLLITAVWRESRGDVTSDVWEEVGLLHEEANERAQEMEDGDAFPNISDLDAAEARKVLREKRQEFESNTTSAVLAALAEEVDI